MRRAEQELWATIENDRVRFPAFVHLPASARPQTRHLLTTNGVESIKCISIESGLKYFYSPLDGTRSISSGDYKRQIAKRWAIAEESIRAIAVNLDGSRVLIEDDDDWLDWLNTYFFRTSGSSAYSSYSTPSLKNSKQEFIIDPIHIHVILDLEDEPQPNSAATAGPSGRAQNLEAPPTYREAFSIANRAALGIPTIQDLISRISALTVDVHAYTAASRSEAAAAAAASAANPSTQQEHEHEESEDADTVTTLSSSSGSERTAARQDSAPASTQTITQESATELVNNVVGSMLRALQPHIQGVPQAILSSIPALTAEMASASGTTTSERRTSTQPTSVTEPSTGPANASTGLSTSAQSNHAQESNAGPTQRQSLMDGMLNELARVRAQQIPSFAPQQSSQVDQTQPTTEESMENELSRGFAQMLAEQASVPAGTTADITSTADTDDTTTTSASESATTSPAVIVDPASLWDQLDGDDDVESLTYVSTPSGSSRGSFSPNYRGSFNAAARGSNSSRSRGSFNASSRGSSESPRSRGGSSRGSSGSSPRGSSDSPHSRRGSSSSRSRPHFRSPRRGGRASRVTSASMFVVTIIGCILAFISPTLASPNPALNPSALVAHSPPTARTASRHLHLCKCTCFQTNSTLVPLYSPLDPAKPCSTCTRQFCLDQGLEMCKGAKLEHTDHDVGTGFEGDVWAKCFERESGKDQGIISLYILVVVALVVWAGVRGRVEGWVQQGPRGVYDAVRQGPWRTSAR